MAEIASAYVNIVPRFDPDIPRIQILELPMEHNGDYSVTPFAVVIDGAAGDFSEGINGVGESMKEALGARAVLVFKDRVQV